MHILLNITTGLALGAAAFYIFMRGQRAMAKACAVSVVRNDGRVVMRHDD